MNYTGEQLAESLVIGIRGVKTPENTDNGGYFFDEPPEEASYQAEAENDYYYNIKWIHGVAICNFSLKR